MSRPSKSLADLVRDGTFRPARHHELLGGDDLPWPAFAALQARYRAAADEAARREIAVEFLRLVRLAHAEARRAEMPGPSLRDELDKLGPPGTPERLLRFFPRFLFHTKGPLTGRPFVLEPYEKRFLRELWRRDRAGRRVYTRGLFGGPKGIGKTPLLAGVCTYALCDEQDAPELYQIAGSKEQAGIGLRFAKSWSERASSDRGEPMLGAWLSVGSAIRRPETGGVYRVLSSDGRLAQGVMPSGGAVDEWWLFATPRERETYLALSNALHKRRDAWLVAASTAGWDETSQLAETYRAAIAHPRLEVREGGYLLVLEDEESGFLMHWWSAPEDADIEDPETIRRANPASWVRTEDILRTLHQPGADEADFRRLNLNQWVSVRGAWIPASVWRDLACDVAIPAGAPIAVGVDAGLTYDTTAVAWAWRAEDGRVVMRTRVWSVRQEAPAHEHVPGDRLDNEALAEAFVRELARTYSVRIVVCDRRYFPSEAQHLADAGLDVLELEQGSATMADATTEFHAACIGGRIAHDGDPVLAAHLAATTGRRSERGWRVRKLEAGRPIDATTAAIMAHYGATRLMRDVAPLDIRWL